MTTGTTAGEATGQAAPGGTAAGRGEDTRDVDAIILEETLLHGDRIGHAVELPAPMRDGDGLGPRGRCFRGDNSCREAQNKTSSHKRFSLGHDVFLFLCIFRFRDRDRDGQRLVSIEAFGRGAGNSRYSLWLSARP